MCAAAADVHVLGCATLLACQQQLAIAVPVPYRTGCMRNAELASDQAHRLSFDKSTRRQTLVC
jgi:Asp/Glu/hydantoin racemase